MKRVAIIGSPGVGKTTFSRQLQEKTGLPLIHLDYYYHQTKHGYYDDSAKWVKKVEQLIKPDRWIVEGNYNSSMPQRCATADTIFFFDLPRRIALHGVIKRRIQYRNKLREEMPSEWKEKANWGFLKYVWNFRRDVRPKTVEIISKLGPKTTLITFKSRKQIRDYLAKL